MPYQFYSFSIVLGSLSFEGRGPTGKSDWSPLHLAAYFDKIQDAKSILIQEKGK